MAADLLSVLGWQAMSGVIQSTTTGIPKPLPDPFFNTITPTIADTGEYTQVNGTRTTARQVMYGSPALRRQLKDVAVKPVKLIHTYEEIALNPLTLQKLRALDSYTQDMGKSEVDRQTREFKANFANLRIAAVLQCLANGVIYFDSSGNLLPSSSGASITIDYGMSANNQNQLNSVIAASWATAGTDIPSHLRNLRKTARKLTGYPLKLAIYGEAIPSYIAKNDYVKDWFTRHPEKRAEYMDTGELPNGLMGFTWIPAYEAFYEDSAGTNQDLWAADKVVFTPEPSRDWWEVMEGTYMVPTTLNIQGDGNAALASMRQAQGMFGYGIVGHNPPGVVCFYGDTFLPILKVPNAIFQADVVP